MNKTMEVVVFVDSVIDDQLTSTSCNDPTQCINQHQNKKESMEKHSAVWTTSATSTLLRLYESKLEMLETPKRKKIIWLAISESLKEQHNIQMSPDQVRWKINALSKKYKHCLDAGVHGKFKYFKEIDNIYSKYNIDSYGYTVSEILDRKHNINRNMLHSNSSGGSESKAIIELRKLRLANRIESDKSQTKIHMEKQWLEYLNRQEQAKLRCDDIFDRSLKIKEQELELRRRELELKHALEIKNVQMKEKDINEVLLMEKDKCELLKQLFR